MIIFSPSHILYLTPSHLSLKASCHDRPPFEEKIIPPPYPPSFHLASTCWVHPLFPLPKLFITRVPSGHLPPLSHSYYNLLFFFTPPPPSQTQHYYYKSFWMHLLPGLRMLPPPPNILIRVSRFPIAPSPISSSPSFFTCVVCFWNFHCFQTLSSFFCPYIFASFIVAGI